MISRNKLRVLLVSDTQGHDDEGMKKIARMLAAELNGMADIHAQVVTPREASKLAGSFDILHYIGGPTYRSVLLSGVLKSRNVNLRTILTFTNPFWGLLANILVRIFRPDHVIVASRYWRGWAEKRELSNSMFSISGVDIDRFLPIAKNDREELRRQLQLPLNKVIALHVGHLKYDRNITLLLEAQRDPGIQVVIVGSTTTEQSKDLVKMLEDAGCIVIASYQSRIQEYYQAADCYVFPTVDSKAAVQVPLSILEAMAVEIPVVSTPFGGLPSLFQDGKDLFFLSQDEAKAGGLAKIVRVAAASKSTGRDMIEEHSWPAIAARLRMLYQEIVLD